MSFNGDTCECNTEKDYYPDKENPESCLLSCEARYGDKNLMRDNNNLDCS